MMSRLCSLGPLLLVLLIASSSLAWADAVLLNGVTPTGFERPYVPICVLYSALDGLGCHVEYDDLMVASGAAFRMSWMPGGWTTSAGYAYQQDPIAMGAAAAGARADLETYPDADVAFAAAKASIDHGCPVIAYDNGQGGYQVICGYDEANKLVYRRAIYTGHGDPEAKPAEVLKAREGAGAPYVLWLLSYDKSRGKPKLDWPMILVNALRLAQWKEGELLNGLLKCGDSGFYQMVQEIRQEKIPERYPNAGQFTYRVLQQIAGSRGCAARVLEANVGVHKAFLEAGIKYEDEAGLLTKAADLISGQPNMDYLEAIKVVDENFQNLDTRLAVADLIEQAVAKDQTARAALTKALKDLAPDLVPAE